MLPLAEACLRLGTHAVDWCHPQARAWGCEYRHPQTALRFVWGWHRSRALTWREWSHTAAVPPSSALGLPALPAGRQAAGRRAKATADVAAILHSRGRLCYLCPAAVRRAGSSRRADIRMANRAARAWGLEGSRWAMRPKGVEPSRPYGHRHLKPARLPIPPRPRLRAPRGCPIPTLATRRSKSRGLAGIGHPPAGTDDGREDLHPCRGVLERPGQARTDAPDVVFAQHGLGE